MKEVDKETKNSQKFYNHIENERQTNQRSEQRINELIEKEKEIRVITMEKEKDEKTKEIKEKEMKNGEEYIIRKQKFEELFQNLQNLKDDIFKLKSFTGHSKKEVELNQSLTNFKFYLNFFFLMIF